MRSRVTRPTPNRSAVRSVNEQLQARAARPGPYRPPTGPPPPMARSAACALDTVTPKGSAKASSHAPTSAGAMKNA